MAAELYLNDLLICAIETLLTYFGNHHAGRNSAWREGHRRSTNSRREMVVGVERCSFVVTNADSLEYRTSVV
jgi:hypothetical protein